MKTVSLSGSLRENVGKKDAKKSRKLGLIPCVLYGGEEQIHFTILEKHFDKIIFTPEVYLINLTIDDKEYTTMLQDVQYHPVTDSTLHVDFLQLLEGNPISIAVPIILEGSAPGVMQGGRLIFKIRKLRVRGLAEDLPDQIVVDISKLNIGDGVKIEELKLDKLSYLDNANSLIVAVRTARGIEEDEEEEEDEEGEEGEEGAETPEGDKPAEKTKE